MKPHGDRAIIDRYMPDRAYGYMRGGDRGYSKAPDTTPPQTFLKSQNFETPTTGFDNSETWTTAGTVNPVYTPALLGTQSMRLQQSGSNLAYSTFTNQDEVWAFCLFRFTASFSNVNDAFAFTDNPVANVRLSLSFNPASGSKRQPYMRSLRGGTLQAGPTTSAFNLSPNTTYYCWLHFKKNATCELFISSTPTKSAVDSTTNCYQQVSVDNIQVGAIFCFNGATNGDDMIYDHILVSPTTIGDNP